MGMLADDNDASRELMPKRYAHDAARRFDIYAFSLTLAGRCAGDVIKAQPMPPEMRAMIRRALV